MRLAHKIAATGIILAVFTCVVDTAQAGPTEDAATLKASGDAAFDARRFAEALQSYQGALEKNRDARLHYNIAQALSALERYPEALLSYQAFIAEAPAGTMNEEQQAALFALLEELKGKIARLEVTCDVAGARVLVRGKTVGTTPLPAAVALNAGDAKVEVLAEGYKSYESTLSLTGGATRPLNIRLQRVDFRGGLMVTSNVAGAQVYVDSAPRGATPLDLRLERGAHVVEVKAEDHVAFREVAKVEAGKDTAVNVTLERAPDYTLAYLGFGIGAVGVAAGTATGILAYSRFGKAKEQCDEAAKECGPAGQDELQSSKTWGVLSTVGFSVGAAGIALGSYGLMTAKPSGREAPVDVALHPRGVALRGTF